MRLKLILLPLILLMTLPLMAADDCSDSTTQGNARKAVEERNRVYNKAQSVYPVPDLENFPLREALVQFTERQDLINHPWYVYVFPPLGSEPMGYYVAKSVPQNICNFLSSTQDVRDSEHGNLILTAPSLDGVFYGGSGASNGCDAVFFFDYATDALIQIGKLGYFTADQPLNISVPRLEVK